MVNASKIFLDDLFIGQSSFYQEAVQNVIFCDDTHWRAAPHFRGNGFLKLDGMSRIAGDGADCLYIDIPAERLTNWQNLMVMLREDCYEMRLAIQDGAPLWTKIDSNLY